MACNSSMSLAVNLASFSLANSCFGGIFDRSPLGVDALKMNQILLYWIFKEKKITLCRWTGTVKQLTSSLLRISDREPKLRIAAINQFGFEASLSRGQKKYVKKFKKFKWNIFFFLISQFDSMWTRVLTEAGNSGLHCLSLIRRLLTAEAVQLLQNNQYQTSRIRIRNSL